MNRNCLNFNDLNQNWPFLIFCQCYKHLLMCYRSFKVELLYSQGFNANIQTLFSQKDTCNCIDSCQRRERTGSAGHSSYWAGKRSLTLPILVCLHSLSQFIVKGGCTIFIISTRHCPLFFRGSCSSRKMKQSLLGCRNKKFWLFWYLIIPFIN